MPLNLFDRYKADKELAARISENDNKSWNNFVEKYSPFILSSVINWCRTSCRIINGAKDCAVESIRNKSDSSPNACDEGIELYVYIFQSLKPKIGKYQGKSSLKTYISACLNFIYKDYFINKHGKINIPTALKDCSDTEKKVYKVLCRSSDLENGIERLEALGFSRDITVKSFNNIISLLKEDGRDKSWQHLYSRFSSNKKTESIDSIEYEDKNPEKYIAVFDQDYADSEVLLIFKQSFNQLESREKRLLKLKFRDNLSTKEIFNKYSKLFSFKKEQDIYPELEKTVKKLVLIIKGYYEDSQGKIDFKEFKEALYDVFKSVEV